MERGLIMRVYLQEFMESYDYPCDAINTLLAAYDVLGKHADFQELLAIYEKDRFFSLFFFILFPLFLFIFLNIGL